jgi:Zn-dependent M28 family amino/carboxypeptidase
MIKKKRRPQSFATGRTVTMKNESEHHAGGVGKNVIAYLAGSDPVLKDEVVILSAHLDHLGLNPSLMPGANDNASGVAVLMAVAEALAKFEFRPRRTVAFVFFGAEEQGVWGSEFYLRHVPPQLQHAKALINLDGVGRGKRIYALAAKNYPALWKFFVAANRALVPAAVIPEYFHNRARPRLDAARFMWAGIPTVSFSVGDAPELPYPVYHTRNDRPEILTPAIMVDLGKLIFAALVGLAPCR